MRRRTFFKSLIALPGLALVQPREVAEPTPRDRALADEMQHFIAKMNALDAEADAQLALRRASLPAWPGVPAFTQVYTTPTYTDSDGRPPAELSALHDGNRASGVEYQA